MKNIRKGKGFSWREAAHGFEGTERTARGFTVDNLDLFDEFTIKVIMSGSDQSKPVVIKDFRAVATR